MNQAPRRLSRVWGSRSVRRQKTFTHENTILQEKTRGEKITIKNLMYYVRLKRKVSQLASDLSSRRWKTLKRMHFKQIGDKSFYPSEESKRRLGYYKKEIDQEEDNYYGEEQENEEKFTNQSFMKQLSIRKTSRSAKVLSASKALLFKIKLLADLIPIFNPNSVSKLLWDSFYNILALFLSIIVPLKLAIQEFELSYFVGSSGILGFIIIIIICDMILNLNTAFFKRGKIQFKRYAIFKNYMSSMGVYDVLITQALVWELWAEKKTWMEQAQNVLLCVLLYFKILKLHKLMFKIEETFSFKRRTLNMLSLAKLLLFILKISHAFACLWVFIGRQMVAGHNDSWMSAWANHGWGTQYLQAYYFISVTMTTIGFGDIVPKNAVETVVCIFSMFLACVIFGYTINIIGSIFMELKKEDEAKKENLLIINRYMNEKNISRDLQSSIREYLEYFWKQQSNDNSEKEAHILEQLSEDMRQALLIQANRIILEDCQFFKRHFSRDTIQKSVHLIKEKKLTPYEPIINSYDDQAKSGHIFFVESGEIDIYQEFLLEQMTENPQGITNPGGNEIEEQNNNNTNNNANTNASANTNNNINHLVNTGQPISAPPIPLAILQLLSGVQQTPQSQAKTKQKHLKKVKTLRKGDFFGEYSFFTNFPNSFIAKSCNFSKILYIERSKFLEYLQLNNLQDDLETFHNIKDNLVQNQYSSLFVKCHYCASYDHTVLTCPTMHYIPAKMNVINRYNFSQSITERRPTKRRKVPYKNCRVDRQKFEEIQEIYERKNHSFILDHYKHNSQSDSEDRSNSSETSQDDDNDSQSDSEDENVKRQRHDTAAAVAAITHPKKYPSGTTNTVASKNNYMKQPEQGDEASDENDDNSNDHDNNDIQEEDDQDLLSYGNKDDLLPTYKRDSFLDHLKKENHLGSPETIQKYHNQTFSEVVEEENDSLTLPYKKSDSPNGSQRNADSPTLPHSELDSEKKDPEKLNFIKHEYPRLILPGDPDHTNIADSLDNQKQTQLTATTPNIIPKINIQEINNNRTINKSTNNISWNSDFGNNSSNNFHSLNVPNSNYDNTPTFFKNSNQSKIIGQLFNSNTETQMSELKDLNEQGSLNSNKTTSSQQNSSSSVQSPPRPNSSMILKVNGIPGNPLEGTVNGGSPQSPVPQRLLSKHFLDPKKSKGNFLDPQNSSYFEETSASIEPMKNSFNEQFSPEEGQTVSKQENQQKAIADNQQQDNDKPNNEIHLLNFSQKQAKSRFQSQPGFPLLIKQKSLEKQQSPKKMNLESIKINNPIINIGNNLAVPSDPQSPEEPVPLKRFLSVRSEDPEGCSQSHQVSQQQLNKLNRRRDSVLSHSFNFRSSFLSQNPPTSQGNVGLKPSIFQPQLTNQQIMNQEHLRRVSMAYFASPEERLKLGFPRINTNNIANLKQNDLLTSSPGLTSQLSAFADYPNSRKQRIQAAIAKTIEKFIEEENQPILSKDGNNAQRIQGILNGEDEANKLMMFIDQQQNQQQLQLTETLFQNWDVEFHSTFEHMKSFKNYFPAYNYDKVLQRIKKKRQPSETAVSKLLFKYQRSNKLKSNTFFISNLKNEKDGSISPIHEPVTMKHERTHNREFSTSSNIKMPSLTQMQSEIDIPTSPSNTNTQLLTVNINRRAKFQPLKFNVASPQALRNSQLLNKVTSEESPGFSDEEYQELQKKPTIGAFMTKQSLKTFLP